MNVYGVGFCIVFHGFVIILTLTPSTPLINKYNTNKRSTVSGIFLLGTK